MMSWLVLIGQAVWGKKIFQNGERWMDGRMMHGGRTHWYPKSSPVNQNSRRYRQSYMSLVVRKPAFCIYENKDPDQLRGNREADQRLCFRYTDSTIPLLPKSEISSLLTIFYRSTAWFVSDLVENPEDRFSHNEAHM